MQHTERDATRLFTIGQMAKLNAISEKALRVYQRKGILEPAHTDAETGYRYYTLDQCAMLDMVQQLRVVGFTLDQISDVLAAKDVRYLRDRVREHVERIERQKRELAMAHQVGGDLLKSCEAYANQPPLNEWMLCTLPERHILEFDLDCDVSSPSGGGREAIASWELVLRSIRRSIVANDWPIALFRNVGCTISYENLVARRICYDRAFVFVTPAFGGDVFARAKRITSATYLVEYLDDIITEDDRERETVELDAILRRCDEMGLEVAGDYLGEVIADGPAFLFSGRGMLFRLCLPVRLKGQTVWEMPSQKAAMSQWRDGGEEAGG